jgi:polyisoprenyl-teichoic acid--peptidoglycan teichoic acid transferase
MTDLKPSAEDGARNLTGRGESSSARTQPATPVRPAQGRAAQPGPIKPSSATNGSAPIKPAQPRPVQPATVKPAQPRPVQAPPAKPAQPRPVQAPPIKPAQPRPVQAPPAKPAQPPPVQAAPIKPAQPQPAQAAPAKPAEATSTRAPDQNKATPPGDAKPVPTTKPNPTTTKPAPIKPAKARVAQPAPIRPAQSSATQTAPIKPSPAVTTSGPPIKPAEPTAAHPVDLKAPAAAKPNATTTTPASPNQADQAGTTQSADETKASPAVDAKAPVAAKPNPITTKPTPAQSNGGPLSAPATARANPVQQRANQPAVPSKPDSAHDDTAVIKLTSPDVKQAAPPAKPAQPTAAASTRPGLASAPDDAVLSKSGAAVSRPAPSAKPAEPSAAEAAAEAFDAAQAAAEALIRAHLAGSQPVPSTKPPQPSADKAASPAKSAPTKSAPTKSAQTKIQPPPDLEQAAKTDAAQAPAQTKPNAAATAPPVAPTQPGNAAQQAAAATAPRVAPTKLRKAAKKTAAPSNWTPLSAKSAAPSNPGTADSKPAAKPAKRGRVLGIVLASVAATLVAVLALAAVFVNQVEQSLTQNLDHEDLMPTDTAPHPTKEQVAGDALNFVVMGYDSRDPSVQRSGSFRIVHLNAKRDQAYFITFPRYTWVAIPGHGNKMIGEAYSIGGSKLAVSTLENLTDTQIDHAALADIQGFAKLTDEVGGVTVYNRTDFWSHGIHYPKGNITVSGREAIYFIGESKALPRGDFDRAANERNVVRAILAKTLSAKTMSDPARLFSVVSGVAEHLTVDKGLTNAKIRSTIFSLRLSNKDVHLIKAPVVRKRTKNGTHVVVDQAKLDELRTALRNDKVDEYLAKYPQG